MNKEQTAIGYLLFGNVAINYAMFSFLGCLMVSFPPSSSTKTSAPSTFPATSHRIAAKGIKRIIPEPPQRMPPAKMITKVAKVFKLTR